MTLLIWTGDSRIAKIQRLSLMVSFGSMAQYDASRTLFVLGPSGAGKSTFAQYLATEHSWLHLEIDQFPNGDGIDIYGLRRVWNAFYQNNDPTALAEELHRFISRERKAGCVLSFPSGLVLSSNHIQAASVASIKVIYLYGSAAHCINAFLERERNTGRNLTLDHWIANNCAAYFMMSRPEFDSHRIHVFTQAGLRLPHKEVFAQLFSGTEST